MEASKLAPACTAYCAPCRIFTGDLMNADGSRSVGTSYSLSPMTIDPGRRPPGCVPGRAGSRLVGVPAPLPAAPEAVVTRGEGGWCCCWCCCGAASPGAVERLVEAPATGGNGTADRGVGKSGSVSMGSARAAALGPFPAAAAAARVTCVGAVPGFLGCMSSSARFGTPTPMALKSTTIQINALAKRGEGLLVTDLPQTHTTTWQQQQRVRISSLCP